MSCHFDRKHVIEGLKKLLWETVSEQGDSSYYLLHDREDLLKFLGDLKTVTNFQFSFTRSHMWTPELIRLGWMHGSDKPFKLVLGGEFAGRSFIHKESIGLIESLEKQLAQFSPINYGEMVEAILSNKKVFESLVGIPRLDNNIYDARVFELFSSRIDGLSKLLPIIGASDEICEQLRTFIHEGKTIHVTHSYISSHSGEKEGCVIGMVANIMKNSETEGYKAYCVTNPQVLDGLELLNRPLGCQSLSGDVLTNIMYNYALRPKFAVSDLEQKTSISFEVV